MKFSEVPNRSEIKIGEQIGWRMFGKFCFGGFMFDVKDDAEVELISKCKNCKHYLCNAKERSNEKYYCTSIVKYENLPESASISEGNVYLKQDTETFSCSLFEMKEG